MKCCVIVLALLCSFVVVVHGMTAVFQREKAKAFQKCNQTHPVQRDPREIMSRAAACGRKAQLSQEEKCQLFCFLKEMSFFDKDGNIDGSKLTQITMEQLPYGAPYVDVLIAKLYVLTKISKNTAFGDECDKGFEIYHQYCNDAYSIAIAMGLEAQTGVKEKIINSVSTGQPLDDEVKEQVTKVMAFFEARDQRDTVSDV